MAKLTFDNHKFMCYNEYIRYKGGEFIMTNIKDLLLEGIESEKNIAIKEYDDLREQVNQKTEVPELYRMIVEVYHNTLPQRPIAEKVLREALTDDFFKQASVRKAPNEIVFFNERYQITFPLSRGRDINIIDTGLKKPPYFHKTTNDWHLKLIKLTQDYLANKTFANFKALNDLYKFNRKPKNIIGKLYNYHSTYKTFNEDKLKELINNVNQDNERKLEVDRLTDEYNLEKAKSIEFAYTLKSLKQWQDNNWTIRFLESKPPSPGLTLDYNRNEI